jgi:hypothetical protein
MKKLPWVMRLPPGLREQPAWILIGVIGVLAGLSYTFGLAESTSITRVLDPVWLKVWGGFLAGSGMLVIAATWMRNRPLERLALRALSLSLLVYAGWILTAIPLSRAVFTISTCAALVCLSEIRVAVLRMAMRPLPRHLKLDEED